RPPCTPPFPYPTLFRSRGPPRPALSPRPALLPTSARRPPRATLRRGPGAVDPATSRAATAPPLREAEARTRAAADCPGYVRERNAAGRPRASTAAGAAPALPASRSLP